MSSGGSLFPSTTSTFDLYDFFSMLLPGTAFLLGLLPFVPESLPTGAFQTLFVLLVGGYIIGRGLHSAAETVDRYTGAQSHRERFEEIIRTPSPRTIPKETVDAYYDAATERFDHVSWPDDRTATTDSQLTVLYVHTRALIHRDGTGRSRTFQAIFAFYRSISLVIVLLVGLYLVYGVGASVDYWSTLSSYTTYLGALDLPLNVFLLAAETVLGLTAITFHDAKGDYREYFVQYLFVDFLILSDA